LFAPPGTTCIRTIQYCPPAGADKTTTRDGLLGGTQDLAQRPERDSPVELQRMQQLPVEAVERGAFGRGYRHLWNKSSHIQETLDTSPNRTHTRRHA
jgi:hypothetical protein